MMDRHEVISKLNDSSSLHGLSRLSRSTNRPAWITVIVVATALCIAMLAVQLYNFENNNTTTIIDMNYPISLVPFPHMEICKKCNVQRENVRNLEDIVLKRGLAESEDEFFTSLKDFMMRAQMELKIREQLFKTLSTLGFSYRALILEVGTSCEAMLSNCLWKGMHIDCDKMFQRVVSFDGICCRFDMDYFKNNTRDLKINYHPGFEPGNCLRVELNLTAESVPDNGANIYLFYNERTMYDTPYELDVDQYIYFGVEPQVLSSSSYVRNMSPVKRNCGLIDKNSPSAVDAITKYTYEECLTHFHHKAIVEKCDCIPFYVRDTDPRGAWDDVDLCAAENYNCVQTAASNSSDYMKNSGCLHACDEVTYTYRVISGNKNSGSTESALSVFYLSPHCDKYTKVVLLTWDQLFASLGGVFGLCLGGSIMSVAEFFYAFVSLLLSAAAVSIKSLFREGKETMRKRNKQKHDKGLK